MGRGEGVQETSITLQHMHHGEPCAPWGEDRGPRGRDIFMGRRQGEDESQTEQHRPPSQQHVSSHAQPP